MAAQRISIRMTGGGPWGFRLFGGEELPLVIAKLRKHSKAAESGLREGDILLAINGYSCRGLNHPTAMAMVDQAGDDLTFDVLRGTTDKNAVEAAYQSSESQGPVSDVMDSGARESAAQPADKAGEPEQQPPAIEPTVEPINAPPAQSMVNGYSPVEITRNEETFTEGDTTTHVTTETSQQQFGSTTLTKVTREEVTQSGLPSLSPYPVREQAAPAPRKPLYQAPSRPPQSVWQPSGTKMPLKVTSAPKNVKVEHNMDRSVTMSFGIGARETSKENSAPVTVPVARSAPAQAPPTNKRPGCWQPSHIPDLPPAREQTPPEAMPVYEKLASQTAQEPSHFELWRKLAEDEPDAFAQFTYQHLIRILTEPGSDQDSGQDSPATFMKKKKIYADSSFYDDPEHKYPTIEEQIKMARKVAQSLEDANNRAARGQNMYMKRKVKSEKWISGYEGYLSEEPPVHGEPTAADGSSDDTEDKYYNPNPWRVKSAWRPTPKPIQYVAAPVRKPQPLKPAIAPNFKATNKSYTWEPPAPYSPPPPPQPAREVTPIKEPTPPPAPVIPDAPPLPLDFNFVPKTYMSAKLDQVDSANENALSMDEFEKLRLLSSKSEHKGLDPKLAFSLADDLRQMKGKGGRLFAKRRERAEKWTLGDTDTSCNATGPNQNVMEKLIISAGMESGIGAPPRGGGGSEGGLSRSSTLPRAGRMPQNRLKEMIDPPKPAMSPWDSAAAYGTTERAFEHLDPYFALKRGGYDTAVAKSLDLAAQRSYVTPYKPAAVGVPVNKREPRLPEFTSKIKPWTGDTESIPASDREVSSPTSVHSARSDPLFSSTGGTDTTVKPALSSSMTSSYDNSKPLVLQSPPKGKNSAVKASGSDFLAPKAPRAWSSTTSSESSLNVKAVQSVAKAEQPQSSQTGFRPVRFSSPPAVASHTTLTSSQSDMVQRAPPSSGVNGLSGAWSTSNTGHQQLLPQRKQVTSELGYCDL